eukprot:NODE_1825_length_1057_cov_207.468254_g1487_i0.p2 GENE.NODE_1825_length_1057_cov_207.468254_g1487_i0~~NODE_1825_length_1057_cov_207.468254_g1487_i0.p2  ORF type:complete len:281 (-),score=73.49 NODE_1825_length_1057_cov_207.468254_g1487_i0:156-998(-)
MYRFSRCGAGLIMGSAAFYGVAVCKGSAFSADEWRAFPLISVKPTSHNTAHFRFGLPDPSDTIGMDVASCITVRCVGKDGKDVIRPYTPTTRNSELGSFELVVKRYNGGAMSEHIHGLKTGETLEVKGPWMHRKYVPNEFEHIGMIAGGTGVTPMYQIIQEVTSNKNDKTKIDLIFGNLSPEDILLKPELDRLSKEHPNFRVHYTVDRPTTQWQGDIGHINQDLIKKYFPAPGSNTFVAVCGPPPMVGAISGPKAKDRTQGPLAGILKEIGYTEKNVFKF